MISRQELLASRTILEDKAIGCICGLAIGDSLGDAARMPENNQAYGITTDFNDGASWSTDDTEFAILTARILLDGRGEITQEGVVRAWMEHVAVQDNLKRGGNSEISAVRNLRAGLTPPLSGKYSTFHLSDGSAMRIAPIGILCPGDPKKAAQMAEIDACISHYADGIWGAQAVAAAVSVAMVDGSIDEIIQAGIDAMPRDSWLYANTQAALELIGKHQYAWEESWIPLHELLWASDPATTCEAIAATFACLRLGGEGFRHTMMLSCNYGRDADTIGAVCGAILGAKLGASAIPEKWIEKTRYPSGTCLQFTKGLDLVALGRELAALVS